ncbi:amidohydrolase family protein [Nocardioides sp. AE5]|uniref:amidohydrolase family protein n=1 Tax=Nocardioides sp. AE5 TaxID=2962573 RepID=UPI002880F67C|nr:amidohydrolase family protein [Nocardioides sp. AE5]MDT0201832.1 amidohydrolase family protein [Nocardioides sp. AE5]
MTSPAIQATLQRLGIPGLFDVHTHFYPEPMGTKVRAVFETAGPLIGRPWPITYRGSDEELVATLTGFGVRRFSQLTYAHKPGMAEFLNDWSAGFAGRFPAALRCGTFFPEPGAADYVVRRLAGGVELWKVHVQVGNFLVTDPLLDPVWGVLAEAGTPIILHAGSGPVATDCTGPGPVAELLRRHPRLPLVIAHLGAPEYADFLAMAEQYEHVRLDTTMAFTDFFAEMGGAFPAEMLPRLTDLGEKVLLGSDFPNIPYDYPHQIEAIEALGLGDDWLRRVLWQNAADLFGAGPDVTAA